MQLSVNSAGEIMEYATTGNIRSAIKFDGVIPDDFQIKFKPAYYLLIDSEIGLNPNYNNSVIMPPANTPKPQDEINAMLLKEVASLHRQIGGGFGA